MIKIISYIASLFHVLFLPNLPAKLVHNPDTVLFIRGQQQFYSGRLTEARKTFAKLTRRFPASIHHALAVFREADCAWELGDTDAALRAYKAVQKPAADPRVDPAVALGHLVDYHLAHNEQRQARRAFVKLRTRFPTHPLAASPPAGLAEPILSFDESMRLARSFWKARRFERALAVLDQVREPGRPTRLYQLAHLTGRVLFDGQGRYLDAYNLLIAARDHAPSPAAAEEDWFFASRALGRLDRDAEAIAGHLAMLARYPHGRHAARALFYAAWLQANRGRCDLARPLFARLMAEYPASRWVPESRWFQALCQISKKHWKDALAALATERRRPEPERGGRALYWTGVARWELDRKTGARAAWKATIKRFPLGWYSLLARARLADRSPSARHPPKPHRFKPLADKLLVRASELARAGLGTLASLLLRQNESQFLERHPGDRGLAALLAAYRAAGDFNRPWLLVAGKRPGYLRRLPSGKTRLFWDHAYPACERETLDKHSRRGISFTLFLQAVMRTESGFDAFALSTANARGLLQLIPPTALEATRAVNLDFDEDRLFEPDYNIRLAAWSIGRLYERLAKQWPLVAGAYNGGEKAMMKWYRQNGHLALDLFVEQVPWTETRRYIKRVTQAFAKYLYLEGLRIPRLSLRLDPACVEESSGP